MKFILLPFLLFSTLSSITAAAPFQVDASHTGSLTIAADDESWLMVITPKEGEQCGGTGEWVEGTKDTCWISPLPVCKTELLVDVGFAKCTFKFGDSSCDSTKKTVEVEGGNGKSVPESEMPKDIKFIEVSCD